MNLITLEQTVIFPKRIRNKISIHCIARPPYSPYTPVKWHICKYKTSQALIPKQKIIITLKYYHAQRQIFGNHKKIKVSFLPKKKKKKQTNITRVLDLLAFPLPLCLSVLMASASASFTVPLAIHLR